MCPLVKGLVTITTDDGSEVGVIQVSKNMEKLTATRKADGATVKTDYTVHALGDLAEWMQNPQSYRSDQIGGR